MRITEEMKVWLFDLAHGNLDDDNILKGFLKHYVLHDLSVRDVQREMIFRTHYSPEQIEKAITDIKRVLVERS